MAQASIAQVEFNAHFISRAHLELLKLDKADNIRRAALQVKKAWRDMISGCAADPMPLLACSKPLQNCWQIFC